MMTNKLRYLYTQLSRSSTSNIIGELGEAILREHLELQGYRVDKPTTYNSGDWIVSQADNPKKEIRVEVKTARRGGKTKMWQWVLRKNDKHGKTSISDSDVICFLQFNTRTIDLYVVPSGFFPKSQKKFAVRSHASAYNGKLKKFYQSIRNIDLYKPLGVHLS